MRRSQRLRDWLQICKYADIPSSAAPLAPMNPAFMLSIFAKNLYVPCAVPAEACRLSIFQFARQSLGQPGKRMSRRSVRGGVDGGSHIRQLAEQHRVCAGRGKDGVKLSLQKSCLQLCILVLKNNLTGNPGARRRD